MKEVNIVGLDLAKRVFQAHGARADGSVVFRKKLSRGQVLAFFTALPACVVAMEACATAHYWAREIGKLGHEIRLLPPAYVKPFVKRQKNDAADAEAIVEAASRPSMRFVSPKTEGQQARSMIFRTRNLFVRQRTQLINAVRAHLAEHGFIAPQGIANLAALTEIIEDSNSGLELIVVETARLYLEQIDALSARIASLEKTLKSEAKRSESTARLMSMPGMGPVTAMAIEAFAPSMTAFRKGRDFAAWTGAKAAFKRWQAGAWTNFEDGPTRYPAASDHRRNDRNQMGVPQSALRELMASAYVDAQASHARCNCPR